MNQKTANISLMRVVHSAIILRKIRAQTINSGILQNICYAVLIAVLIFSSGCSSTPTYQIEAFSSSVESLTKSTDELLTEYNSSTLDAQLTALRGEHVPVNTGDDTTKNNLSIDRLSTIVNVFDLDTQKKLSIYRANNALKRYADSIGQLASASNRNSVSSASATLVNSLKGMEESYKGLKGDDKASLLEPEALGTFGAIISTIGDAITEAKRKAALKKIITKADPYIHNLTCVIISVLDAADMADDLKTNARLTLEAKIANYNSRVDNGDYRTNQEQQGKDLRAMWDEYQLMAVTEKRLNHLKNSMESIGKQHAVIKEEVTANRFTSQKVMEAVAVIKDMDNRYNLFKNSTISCDKLKINDKGQAICDE